MSKIRYRRNINCLTTNQLHDYREALAELYALPESADNSFAKIASLHGLPGPMYCIHGSPGFLTWHRAYMLAFEKALQSINCDIMLPFWDWSSGPTTGVPSACSSPTYVNRAGITVPNPLYSGPLPASTGGGNTNRSADINTRSFGTMAMGAQSALTAASFSSFQNQINSPHGSVHVQVGGQMGSVPYAGFDPIFYLHHGNVDRLWAIWQKSHPGPLPANEATLGLEPFNKAFSTGWKTGGEFESTEALGYRYINFCFILPPFRFPEYVTLKIEPPWLERLSSARLHLRSDQMEMQSAQLHVFINDPKANERTPTLGNPNFAGSFGFFGMGEQMRKPIREENFDQELDITQSLKQFSEEEKEIGFKLIAVDAEGRPIKPDKLKFSDVELVLD